MRPNIAIVGLGYVGLPVAVAFGRKFPVLGFDINAARVHALSEGRDITGEVSPQELAEADIYFTTEAPKLASCDFIIVAVPTPIDDARQPDLRPLCGAAQSVGSHMRPGTVVVFESTVYPGTTEEVCVPLLEQSSGLRRGIDFHVGYSPERINPGDRDHRFETIQKVVAGDDEATTERIAQVYETVVKAGTYRASSIKVAEAAKVIENTQRDLNIALMNELAIICNRLNIDTSDVLEAAGTKWNFLRFTPGLVGGHCIGVDPYYLTHKAEMLGYHPQVILAGRRINDHMGKFVATSLIKRMIVRGLPVQGSVVTVCGLTFKENVSDIRNSRVIDIAAELQDFGVEVQVTDPLADGADAEREYGIRLTESGRLKQADALVLAVPHQQYLQWGWEEYRGLLRGGSGIVADIKSRLDRITCPKEIELWRL